MHLLNVSRSPEVCRKEDQPLASGRVEMSHDFRKLVRSYVRVGRKVVHIVTGLSALVSDKVIVVKEEPVHSETIRSQLVLSDLDGSTCAEVIFSDYYLGVSINNGDVGSTTVILERS